MRPAGTASEEAATAAARWLARRDAGLSAREEAEFERWRAASPQHAEALARQERIWQALGRPRRTGATGALQAEMKALLCARRRRRAGATAALAVAVALGVAAWRNLAPVVPTLPPAAPAHTAVLGPERRMLPDGTVVEHPAGAVWTFDYSPAERRVSLRRGTAHFAVVKDPARPFVVMAAGVEIRAVGTAFSVEVADSRLEVLVTEGRIAVDTLAPAPQTAAPGAPTLVDAGQRLHLELAAPAGPAPAVEPLAAAELLERLAWRATRVEFSAAPLSEVVAVLNRYQDEKYVLADPALAAVLLSGRFRAGDPEVFTTLLRTGFGIAAERRGADWVLRRAP